MQLPQQQPPVMSWGTYGVQASLMCPASDSIMDLVEQVDFVNNNNQF